MLPIKFTSTKEGLRFGPPRASPDAFEASYGYFDLASVVVSVLSLFAMTLNFDVAATSSSRGALSLLLTYPVTLVDYVAAKALAAAVLLASILLMAEGTAAAVMFAFGLPLQSGVQWLVFYLAAFAYGNLFALLGLTISLVSRAAATAALCALAAWSLFVQVVPRVSSYVINVRWNEAGAAALERQAETSMADLRLKYAREEQHEYQALLASPTSGAQSSFASSRRASRARFEENRDMLRQKYWASQEALEHARDEANAAFDLVSPAGAMLGVASEVAGTGATQRARFMGAARDYDRTVGRRFAESRTLVFATQNALLRPIETVAPLPAQATPFETTWAPSAAVLTACTRWLLSLFLVNVVPAACLVICARRTDI